MGVSYLVNNINQDGKFNYCVNALTGSIADDYNILRHAGTIFELCEWVHVTQDHSFLDQIRKGLSFLMNHLEPLNNVACIVEKDEAKLGGATLSLLALCSYYRLTSDRNYEASMRQLADFILMMQKDNGDFHSRLYYPDRKLMPMKSKLYSSQALLAIMNYYSVFGGEKYLLAAKRYICFERSEARDADSTHAWLAKGLMAFYNTEPDYSLLLMIDSIGINAIKILYGNSYQFKSNVVLENETTTAKIVSIAEALIPFLETGLLHDEKDKLIVATNAIQNALMICFGNQVIEDRLINGLNLFGGLINSKEDHRIRIDFVQHFISSATNLIRLSSFQEFIPQQASFFSSASQHSQELQPVSTTPQ